MEETEIKIEFSKKKLILPLIIVLALLIIIRCAFVFFSQTGTSRIDSLVNTISYEQGDKADFYTTDKGLYFVTKDGVIFMNNKGSAIQWQDTYTMMLPTVLGEGNALGVAESGGTTLAVYNTEGNLYKITSDEKIVSFAINKNGASVLISRSDNEYTINAYTESGFASFMAKSPVEDGIPIACDISDDGSFLAVSYIYTGYTNLESRLVFYNLKQDPSTEEESEEMVASIVRTGEILGIVSFMNKNNLTAMSNSELICVKLSLDGQNVRCKENWNMKFENSITAMTPVNKKYVAIALGSKNLNAQNAEEENTLLTINLKGDVTSKTVLSKPADKLTACASSVIAKMNRTFQAYNKNGQRLLSYTVGQDVNGIKLYDKNNKALIITPKDAYVMNVKTKGITTVVTRLFNKDEGDGIGSETDTSEIEKITEEPSAENTAAEEPNTTENTTETTTAAEEKTSEPKEE